jgi:hypothetical protein
MIQTYGDEMTHSICQSASWASFVEPNHIGDYGSRGIGKGTHIVKVRDYKDKFVLRTLQDEARRETPGFKYYIEGREEALLAWSNVKEEMVPSGYVIKSLERPFRHKGEEYDQWYPETLTQLFVKKEKRRLGIGMALVTKHISGRDLPIWVESPKWETRAILKRLGYEEAEERYELWQMMEGLTKWVQNDLS